MSDRLARAVPGGKVHHYVEADGTTRCGHDTSGPFWAVWPISVNRRVDLTPLCAACAKADRA